MVPVGGAQPSVPARAATWCCASGTESTKVAAEVHEVVGRQDEHGDPSGRGPLDLGDEPVPVAGVGEQAGVLDEGAVAESPVGPQRRARVGRF
jgi:hypothetical protein